MSAAIRTEIGNTKTIGNTAPGKVSLSNKGSTIDQRIVLSLVPEMLARRQHFELLAPGVEICRLYEDAETGASAALLRYAPGGRVATHTHRGYEHVFILEGEQCDAQGRYGAGELVINAPGTRHAVWSPNGCLALLIWERPVSFDAPAG